jgi:hypothetical protein
VAKLRQLVGGDSSPASSLRPPQPDSGQRRSPPAPARRTSSKELLEFSIVTVPANSEALMGMSAANTRKAKLQRELDLIRLKG